MWNESKLECCVSLCLNLLSPKLINLSLWNFAGYWRKYYVGSYRVNYIFLLYFPMQPLLFMKANGSALCNTNLRFHLNKSPSTQLSTLIPGMLAGWTQCTARWEEQEIDWERGSTCISQHDQEAPVSWIVAVTKSGSWQCMIHTDHSLGLQGCQLPIS
jgi:hypothetical protein